MHCNQPIMDLTDKGGRFLRSSCDHWWKLHSFVKCLFGSQMYRLSCHDARQQVSFARALAEQ